MATLNKKLGELNNAQLVNEITTGKLHPVENKVSTTGSPTFPLLISALCFPKSTHIGMREDSFEC